jgi:hypothetical protein
MFLGGDEGVWAEGSWLDTTHPVWHDVQVRRRGEEEGEYYLIITSHPVWHDVQVRRRGGEQREGQRRGAEEGGEGGTCFYIHNLILGITNVFTSYLPTPPRFCPTRILSFTYSPIHAPFPSSIRRPHPHHTP